MAKTKGKPERTPPPEAKAIGERFLEARKRAGLTGSQVGEALDLTKSAVSQWERGQNFPDVQRLLKFCELTSASADYLLFGKVAHRLDKHEERLLEHYRGASALDQLSIQTDANAAWARNRPDERGDGAPFAPVQVLHEDRAKYTHKTKK